MEEGRERGCELFRKIAGMETNKKERFVRRMSLGRECRQSREVKTA